MTNINNIREYMKVWDKYTYDEGLNYCFNISDETTRVTREILKKQNLSSKAMNGKSSEHLIINENKIDIVFSDIFSDMKDYISPALYVAKIVEKCRLMQYDTDQICGIVGRGLRALPSFIRELDLEQKILDLLPDAISYRSPNEDVIGHTDILLHYNRQTFRLWSYQCTFRGLNNTVSRIHGKRGHLLPGFHVLCPIDIHNNTQIISLYYWKLHSEDYMKNVATCIKSRQYKNYNTINKFSIYNTYFKQINKFLVK